MIPAAGGHRPLITLALDLQRGRFFAASSKVPVPRLATNPWAETLSTKLSALFVTGTFAGAATAFSFSYTSSIGRFSTLNSRRRV